MKNNKKYILGLLARNVKKYREKLNISQQKLAEKTDTTPQTICKIESGISWVRPDLLAKLSIELHISPFQLLIDEENDLEDLKVIAVESVITNASRLLEQNKNVTGEYSNIGRKIN